jgi:hypothetical protein
MDDKGRLNQHYADVFASEPDADLLQMVSELHEAAQWCREGEPSAAVDQVIEQVARQRRQAAASNDSANHVVELDTPKRTLWQTPSPTSLRTGWFRQGLGMVAAILVLVVVGGILAVTFGNQLRSQQSVVGSDTTATTVPGLPMNVTANGISITLGLVDSTTSATRFNLNVQLPAYLAGQQMSGVLGPSAGNNVKIDGMAAAPGDPNVTETDNVSAQSLALSLDYQSPFPTDHTVTLTIQKLWLPPKPASPTTVQINPQALDGPWAFTITPEMVRSQPLPTPAGKSSRVTGISATEAERLVGFPIIEPTPLPTSLTRDPFSVTAYRAGASGSGEPNYVELYFPARSPSLQQGVLLVETTNKAAVPTIKGETASLVSPLSSNGTARTMIIARGTQTNLGIGGVVVTRFDVAEANTRQTYFVWTHHGVSNYIEVITSNQNTNSPVSEDELQQMVRSMIDQRHSPPLIPESVITDVLSVLRGLILAFILVAAYRVRHMMLFGWVVFVIVALFTAFFFVDGIVSRSWLDDVGLVVGGALVLGALALYDGRRRASH